VSGYLDGELNLMVFYRDGDKDTSDVSWNYWFDLPESMLPVREVMPEIIKFDRDKYDYHIDLKIVTITRKPITLPALTIPSGSKQEQIAELEKILAELKQS
jgi:hypothetical protein